MFSKKILPFITLFFLMMSFYGHAQIVTSKKIAIQKGIYKKPEEKKTPETIVEKPGKVIVTSEKKKTETIIEKPTKLTVAEIRKEVKTSKKHFKIKKIFS